MKNKESIVCAMNIEDYEKKKQLYQLRERVLQAELERIDEIQGISVAEARRRLRERNNEKYN